MTFPSGGAQMSHWFRVPKPNPSARVRLFCFPYAGAQAALFQHWPDLLPSTIEVCAVELPGHGSRFRETSYTAIDPLAEAVAEALLPYTDRPFALFGHSMGALLCFDLIRKLRRQAIAPLHLFAGSHRAPHLPDMNQQLHAVPDSQLLSELRRLGGTPEGVLQNHEVISLMLPKLRADLALSETYIYRPEAPFNHPITVFGGTEDTEVNVMELEAWRQHTHAGFCLKMLPGGHFFLRDNVQALLLELAQVMDSV